MSSNTKPQQPAETEQASRTPIGVTPPDSTFTTGETGVGSIRLAFRLVLGSLVLGKDELDSRFQQKQFQMSRYYIPQATIKPDESPTDRARYAIEGALVQAAGTLNRGVNSVDNVSNRAINLVSRLASPLTNSRIMGPARRQFERFEVRGERVVQTWINIGRSEEFLSRALVQDTTTEILEETLDYLATSPEMDQLVEHESLDIADNMVEMVQKGTTRIFGFREWFDRLRSR